MIMILFQLALIGFSGTPLNSDLYPISWLETKHGVYIAHKRGANDFDTAYGVVGLKPSTAYDTFIKSKLKREYFHLTDQDAFLLRFKIDDDFYVKCANEHWKYLRSSRSHARAVYAWRWGVTAENKATDMQVVFDNYVVQYFHVRNKNGQ